MPRKAALTARPAGVPLLLGADPGHPGRGRPDGSRGTERMLPLRVEPIRLAGARVDVEVRTDGWTVDGLPDGVRLVVADPPG